MSILLHSYSRYFKRDEPRFCNPDSKLACAWKPAAGIGENTCRKARLKRVRAQSIWMRHRPRFFVVPGAMVDIGLGPTNGFLVICAFRSGSPRRVQTDAYHRPRILNYVPCHITSFFRFPPSGPSICSTTGQACQRTFRIWKRFFHALSTAKSDPALGGLMPGTPCPFIEILNKCNVWGAAVSRTTYC